MPANTGASVSVANPAGTLVGSSGEVGSSVTASGGVENSSVGSDLGHKGKSGVEELIGKVASAVGASDRRVAGVGDAFWPVAAGRSGAAVAPWPAHALQLLAQLSSIHARVSPRQLPKDAHTEHCVFRSAHPTATGDVGSVAGVAAPWSEHALQLRVQL